jgi:hypothetical protein
MKVEHITTLHDIIAEKGGVKDGRAIETNDGPNESEV